MEIEKTLCEIRSRVELPSRRQSQPSPELFDEAWNAWKYILLSIIVVETLLIITQRILFGERRNKNKNCKLCRGYCMCGGDGSKLTAVVDEFVRTHCT